MSFNRLPYDNCAYELETKRSVDMGNYRLFPDSYENCKKIYLLLVLEIQNPILLLLKEIVIYLGEL